MKYRISTNFSKAKLGQAYIYVLIDPRDKMVKYIGKSIDPLKRYYSHVEVARKNTHHTYKDCWIRCLLKKELKPELGVIKIVPESKWKKEEIAAIKYYKKLGYKLTNTTDGGDCPDVSNCKKVAKIDPTTNKILGIYPSIDYAARKNNIKAKSRISTCCSGKNLYSNGFKWRILDEKNNIISPIKKEFKIKPVAKIDYKTEKILKIYKCLYDVRKDGFEFGNISKVCLGQKKSAYGFIWRHLDDSLSVINPIFSYNHKMINKLTLNGKFTERFLNAEYAAKNVDVDRGDLILRVCNDKTKTAYGFKWEFNNF